MDRQQEGTQTELREQAAEEGRDHIRGTYLFGIAIPNFPQVIYPRFLKKARNQEKLCSESKADFSRNLSHS